MGDPAALQEAIQRARQMAAKMAQNAPIKQTKIDEAAIDPSTVKVTLAYEKPAHSNRESSGVHHSSSASARDQSNHASSRGSRDRDRDERNDHAGGGAGRMERSDRDRPDRGSDRDWSRDRSRGDLHQPYSKQHYNSNPSNNNIDGTSNFSHHNDYQHQQQQPPSSDQTKTEILIPHAVIGLVIGKGGENIKRIQNETGATVRVDPNTIDEHGNKMCTISGTADAVRRATDQVQEVIENSPTSKRPRMMTDGGDQYRMKIPASRTGAIIGKGGETIKSIKQQSGCDIELDKGAKDCGEEESVFIIRGSQEKILKARALIEAKLSNSRDGRSGGDRGGSGGGGGGMGGGGGGLKSAATGANAVPIAPYNDVQTADATAAWTAYYAQYYAQQGMAYPTQAAAQPQQQQPAQQQQQQPQAQPQPAAAGQADYSAEWIQYYRALGYHEQADQIEKMVKARSST